MPSTKERSLRQLAKELGVSPAYLSYMVNAKRPWREDLYERYCRLVNTSVNTVDTMQEGHGGVAPELRSKLVGRVGIEPTTPGLKVRRWVFCPVTTGTA